MTDFTTRNGRQRDQQDGVERGAWGTFEDVAGAGSVMSVRGTGTVDLELPIVNFGYSFRLSADSNADVIMLSLGNDVNDKVALPVLPADLQHQWGVGQGGIQHPTNADRRLEYNDDETWLKDGEYKLGDNKEVAVTIAGGVVSISVTGDSTIAVTGTTDVTSGGALTVTAPTVGITSDVTVTGTLDVNGASVQHNGKNIGDTHTHNIAGGLAPSISGAPN